MKVLGLVVCAVAASGAAAVAPASANAVALQCISDRGNYSMQIDQAAACGSASSQSGRGLAYALDGIGYANGEGTANSLGIGVNGGVGASEGDSGIPTAIGVGPDSVAITSVDGGTFSIAFAVNGSRALVAGTAEEGVLCEGTAALAFDARSGRACFATPFGAFPIG